MAESNVQNYVDGIRRADRRVLSKAITLIESSHPAHQRAAGAILNALLPDTGGAIRLGVSGVPGVGKSTFIESLGGLLVQKGHRIAVLAVDPSSTRSGGSIMADKTRMERLSVAENVFIRPSPSGGALGGVARMTRETMLLCEAAGFDVIIVETVGVGQSETAVCGMVDFFLVLMLAGAGDALQGIKRGILELADAVAVNKADGRNIERAVCAGKIYQRALRLLNPPDADWKPPVLTCSAATGAGIEKIWQTVLNHHRKLQASGKLENRRRHQALEWMESLVAEGLQERFFRHPQVRRKLPKVSEKVRRGRLNPMAAAEKLLFLLDKEESFYDS